MNIRAKLTDSVSIDEMRTVRECGLGNAEIAKRLDVTPATIYRYIGKQPKELHKPCGKAGQRAKQEAEAYERKKREDEEARRIEGQINSIMRTINALTGDDKKAAMTKIQTLSAQLIRLKSTRKEWEEQNRIANDQIAPDEKVEDNGLRITSRVIHAEGEHCRYHIDDDNKTVRIEIKNPASFREHTADTLRDLINELSEALNLL